MNKGLIIYLVAIAVVLVGLLSFGIYMGTNNSSLSASESSDEEKVQIEGIEYTVNNDDSYSVNKAYSCGDTVCIPEKCKGKPVTGISENAFKDNSGIVNITLPDSIKEIGAGAFSNCTGLASITIPEAVTEIKEDTFSNCLSLAGVIFKGDVTAIGDNAFADCPNLKEIILPESLVEIGTEVFKNNGNIDIKITGKEHIYGKWMDEIPVTCEEDGIKGHYHCNLCGKDFDKDKQLLEDIVIPALGHDLSDLIAEKPATCEEDGIKAHYHCNRCKKDFDKDKQLLEDIVIPALGHDWGEVEYNFAEDGSSCTAERVCGRDAMHKETAVASISSTVTRPASCNFEGEVTYTATFKEDWAKEQTLTIESIPALGHNWNETVYNFAEDGSSCTAERVCKRDASHKEIATATITEAVTRQATCTEKGETTYTATFEEDWAGSQILRVKNIPALGHDWTEPVYNFAEDGKSCTAERVCKRDASHKETAAATITETVTRQATCTEKGETTYTATFKEDWAEKQILKVENIAELGHDWNETIYNFAKDGKSCTAERVCKRDAAHIEKTAATITEAVTRQATCTEKGETTYTATFEEDWAGTQILRVKNIPALGHNWGETEYIFAEDGKSCTAERVCKRDASHKEIATATITEAVTRQATCTEKGETTYTATFKEDWAEKQILKVEDIAELGHDWCKTVYNFAKDGKSCTAERVCKRDAAHIEKTAATITEAVTRQATCTEKGETTYTATFEEDWAKKQILKVEDIAELGHNYGELIEEIPATCEEDGAKAHYHCDRCGKNFDKDRQLLKDIVIPALGHDWNEPVYSFAEDGSSCTAERVCKRDKTHKEKVTADITDKVVKKATCTEKGETVYTATFKEDWANPQTLKIENIPALGHDWNETVYYFAEDGSSCTAERVCKRDAAHKETATATITEAVTRQATCTEKGETTYTATFEEDWAKKQILKVEDIAELGHNYGELIEEIPATCEEDGAKAHYHCDRCGKNFDKDRQLLKDIVIPALGHDWNEPVYSFAEDGSSCIAERVCKRDETHKQVAVATITNLSTRQATCTEKGETTYTATFKENWAKKQILKVEDVPAFGHSYGDLIKEIPATCEGKGIKAHYHCSRCGKDFDKDKQLLKDIVIPALGHDWNETVYYFAEDGSSCTAERVCKRNAAHIEKATATITKAVTKKATCIEKGNTTYTAAFKEDWAKIQTLEIENIPALGHDWNEPVYNFAKDGKSCTAERVCKRDKTHKQVAVATITNLSTRQATCTLKGETTYTATFKENWAKVQIRKINDIPALGHNWSKWKTVKDPTSSESGEITRTCSVCSGKEQKVLPAFNKQEYRYTHVRDLTPSENGLDKYEYMIDGQKLVFDYMLTPANSVVFIKNTEDLRNIEKYISDGVHFVLKNDVVLPKNFVPLGMTNGKKFKGVFDGGNHVIKNIEVGCCSGGLFNENAGTIINVRLSNITVNMSSGENFEDKSLMPGRIRPFVVKRDYSFGGIAITNTGSIKNCCIEGKFSVSTGRHLSFYRTSAADISDLFAHGDMEYFGNYNVGGIAAYNNGEIIDCNISANMSVKSDNYVIWSWGMFNLGDYDGMNKSQWLKSNLVFGGITAKNGQNGNLKSCQASSNVNFKSVQHVDQKKNAGFFKSSPLTGLNIIADNSIGSVAGENTGTASYCAGKDVKVTQDHSKRLINNHWALGTSYGEAVQCSVTDTVRTDFLNGVIGNNTATGKTINCRQL